MYLLKAAIFFAIIPFALATDCTASDSSPWPFEGISGGSSSGGDSPVGSSSRDNPPVGSSSGGGSTTDECAIYVDDAEQYQACEKLVLQAQCNSAGGSACSDTSDSSVGGGDLISNPGDDLISSGNSGNSGDGGLIKRLETRATLICNSSETCYQYTNDTLVCHNLLTGDYHDDAGGKGNINKGTYTGPNEDVTGKTTSTVSGSERSSATDSNESTSTRTSATGGSPTSSTAGAVSNAAATSATAAATTATTAAKTATAAATTATATAIRASPTPTSGGEVLRAHAVVGGLALCAALVW